MLGIRTRVCVLVYDGLCLYAIGIGVDVYMSECESHTNSVPLWLCRANVEIGATPHNNQIVHDQKKNYAHPSYFEIVLLEQLAA